LCVAKQIITIMVVESSIKSLSALEPINFVYEYTTKENLLKTPYQYDNKLRYTKYKLFENLQDIAVSNKNILFLTDVSNLNNVFEQTFNTTSVGKIPGSFYLKPKNNSQYIKTFNNELFVGGQGQKTLITVVPLENNKCELKTSPSTRLQITKDYPYTIINSNEILADEDLNLVQFELDFIQNQMTFKIETQEGFRYLSYGVDLQLRAVGLMLNETIINSYLFVPEFISQSSLDIGYIPTSTEIRYFNEFNQQESRTTVDIKEYKKVDTHLLVSCATELTDQSSNTANINIAHLKTNFNASGTYNPAK
jgi:hypothetical protein